MDSKTKTRLTHIGNIDYFNEVIKKLTLNQKLNNEESTYILTCAILLIREYEKDKIQSYIELAYYIILKYSLIHSDYQPLYDFATNFGFYPISNALIKENLVQISDINNL